MEKTRKLFISNLKRLRNARGLTQAKIAELIEISLSGYAQIEYGTSWPTPKTLGLLAEKLGVSESDFFKNDDEGSKDESRSELIAALISIIPTLDDEELGAVLDAARACPSQFSTAKRATR